MKRIVLLFGFVSGLIVTTQMVGTSLWCYSSTDFEGNMILGFAGMLIAFSFIFVGIKNYRDNLNNGEISFGKALQIGLLISFVASTMYVLVWLVEYYMFIPDFMDKYEAHVLKQTKLNGANPEELQAKAIEMTEFKNMYNSPAMVVLITYSEILPIGIVVSLISALILKKKKSGENIPEPVN